MTAEATTPKLSRSEQARINGRMGRGPVTEQGKIRSSQNAFQHGAYSNRIILPGESTDEFFKLLHSYEDQFRPTDQLERDLIQDLTDARWRIERMKRQETLEWSQATMDAAQDPALADAPYEVLHEYAHRQRAQMKGNPLENIRRAEARYRRDFDRALKTLNQHRREKLRNEPNIEQPATQPEPENVRNEPNEAPAPEPPYDSLEDLINDLPPICANLPMNDPRFIEAVRALHDLRIKNQ